MDRAQPRARRWRDPAGDHYFDRGEPAPDYLAGPFADLTDTGALALADPDPTGRQQVTITDTGHAQYTQLRSAARNH
ncbi:MAG: hypothetical protein ACREMY_11695 [bacterium]